LSRPVVGTVQGIADCPARTSRRSTSTTSWAATWSSAFVGNFDGKKVLPASRGIRRSPGRKALDPVAGDPATLAADTTLTSERDLFAPVMTYGFAAPGYQNPTTPRFQDSLESYLASADRSPVALWMPQTGLAGSVGVLYAPYPKRSSMAVYLTRAQKLAARARHPDRGPGPAQDAAPDEGEVDGAA